LLRVAVAQVGRNASQSQRPGEPGTAKGFASVNCGWPFTKLLVLTVVTENGPADIVTGMSPNSARSKGPIRRARGLPGLIQPVCETKPRGEIVVVSLRSERPRHLIGGLERNGGRGNSGLMYFFAAALGITILPVARSKE